jgi:hypothetical protein
MKCESHLQFSGGEGEVMIFVTPYISTFSRRFVVDVLTSRQKALLVNGNTFIDFFPESCISSVLFNLGNVDGQDLANINDRPHIETWNGD